MRALLIASTFSLLLAAPLFAQTERAYINGAGGFATAPNVTSGDIVGEAGVRVAPRLLVFGNVGHFHNLETASTDPAVTAATTTAAGTGLDISGTATVPAWYSTGGVRYEIAPRSAFMPYVLGSVGFAHMTPSAHFTYTSGVLPDGTTPSLGADVTAAVTTAGDFTQAAASTSLMYTLGGGVEVPVARHWGIDAGYRYSRIQSDSPFNLNGATFGVGYRF